MLTMSVYSWLSSVYKLWIAVFNRCFSKLHEQVFHKQRVDLFSRLESLAQNKKEPLKIVEIGSGTGINLKYFPERSVVICVDPNPYMFKLFDSRRDGEMQVQHMIGFAEDMNKIASNSVDVVVSTTVMCSVSDVDKSLAEVKRILKPGGIYLYIEHVVHDANSVIRAIQMLINPLWRLLFDGCNITIDLAKHLEKAGFSAVAQEHIYMPCNGLTKFIASFPLIRKNLIGCAKK